MCVLCDLNGKGLGWWKRHRVEKDLCLLLYDTHCFVDQLLCLLYLCCALVVWWVFVCVQHCGVHWCVWRDCGCKVWVRFLMPCDVQSCFVDLWVGVCFQRVVVELGDLLYRCGDIFQDDSVKNWAHCGLVCVAYCVACCFVLQGVNEGLFEVCSFDYVGCLCLCFGWFVVLLPACVFVFVVEELVPCVVYGYV